MASSGQIQDPVLHDNTAATTLLSNAVEMNTLETSTAAAESQPPTNEPLEAMALETGPEASSTTETPSSALTTVATADAPEVVPSVVSATAELPAETPALSRLDSVAIGPATETAPAAVVDEANPVCIITLLLGSGARHPYKLDERYLTKRNVTIPGETESGKKDPFSISVYTLKELILREWREEWEAQPSSPSSIRLIHFGRLLDDKTPLNECRFNADSPNVVHMSIKPQDIVDEEEASKGKALRGEREGTESTAGCRCVIL